MARHVKSCTKWAACHRLLGVAFVDIRRVRTDIPTLGQETSLPYCRRVFLLCFPSAAGIARQTRPGAMSLDIDWSLLNSSWSAASPSASSAATPGPTNAYATSSSHAQHDSGRANTSSSLAYTFVKLLNKQLEAAQRPSFLGPVSVTEFDFGDIGPDVEIRDVGDIWPAFEEEEDDEDEDFDGHIDDEDGEEFLEHYDVDGGNPDEWDDSSYLKYDRRRRRQERQREEAGRYHLSTGRGRTVHDEHLGGEDWSYVDRKHVKTATASGAPSLSDRLARDRLEHRRFRDELSMDPSQAARRHVDAALRDQEQEDDHDDSASVSVLSGIMSPRPSLRFGGAAIGIGLSAGMGVNLVNPRRPGSAASSVMGLGSGVLRNLQNPSASSQALNANNSSLQRQRGGPDTQFGGNMRPVSSRPAHVPPPNGTRRYRYDQDHDVDTRAGHRPSHTPDLLSPSAPSARLPSEPSSPSGSNSQSLPSLQLLLHLSHSPNIHLTLLTTLQINYPSTSFMSLPLKITITGLTLCADIVVAFDGAKKRVHLCVIDEFDAYLPSPALSRSHSTVLSSGASVPVTPETTRSALPGGGAVNNFRPLSAIDHRQPGFNGPGGASRPTSMASSSMPDPSKPIGQRLLPSLQIESEIGDADARPPFPPQRWQGRKVYHGRRPQDLGRRAGVPKLSHNCAIAVSRPRSSGPCPSCSRHHHLACVQS